MTYLALDTSTDLAGLALIREGAILAEESWLCRQNHATELMPHLAGLLLQAGLDIKDVQGVIVASGPGAFNGLRVGLGTAKGLAFALNIPIAGVSTLAAAAYQYGNQRKPVCAVLPAGRTEVAWAIYRQQGEAWQELAPENITDLAALAQHIQTPTAMAGELTPAIAAELRERLGAKAVIPAKPPLSRVAALARLGAMRLDNGDADNVAALQPTYLRRPPITLPQPRASRPPAPALPAVIWDMDGTIADTGAQHFRAWRAAFARAGVDFTEAAFRVNFGRRNDDIIKSQLPGVSDEEMAAISDEKETAFRRLVETEGVTAFPGVLELIRALRRAHIKLALASSAPLANIRLILRALGLSRSFQAVVSGRDVAHGKPNPELFLLAAARLQAKPAHAVVVEDAVAGVEAAKRAGMKAVAVTNTSPREKLARADLVVDSLAEVTVQAIIGLANIKEER